MKHEDDAAFFDDELEAQVHAAFDGVGPSEEARARILANLLAAEAQMQGATQPQAPIQIQQVAKQPQAQDVGQAVQAPQAQQAAQVQQAVQAAQPPQAAQASQAVQPQKVVDASDAVAVQVADTATPAGMSSEAAQIVAAARAAAPRPKKRVRVWQIVVPAAAVLVLGGVVVASGPLLSQLSLGGNTQTATPAGSTVYETASEEDGLGADATAESSEAEKSVAEHEEDAAAPGFAEEDSLAPEVGVDAPDDGDPLTEQLNSRDTIISPDMEEFWARDYPTVVLNDGREIHIIGGSSPTAVSADKVGDFVDEAIGYNDDETASVACTVYESLDEESPYLVSYLGAEVYYPAQ